jgi:ATP-dependent exoDNAse (exonuclease V) beta subunit
LREQGRALFTPHQLIRSTRLHHQQVYMFRLHQDKLASTLSTREHRPLQPIGDFLTDMAESCPHHLFQSDARASQGKATFDLDAVEIKTKRNHACRLADLVLQTVTHNKRRHDELQRFMLTVDSVTVAVEVPIYLTPADIAHMQRQLGFQIPIDTDATLTGHIDVLQIRNGAIHILDYKPGAAKEKPITQLMVYALALSRRTGLRLYDFVCAWFDEHHYFEFYPLHVVHKRLRH